MIRQSVLLSIVVFASGCVTHRLVERTPQGGTYAIYGDPGETMTEIRPEMESACGGPVQIVREGEVPIGEVTQTDGATRRHRGGLTLGSSTSETTQKTEWRVTYACGTASEKTAATPEAAATATASDPEAPAN